MITSTTTDISNNHNEQSSIYQPTKQEIERFQLIQEQIKHHQQEEQREIERRKKLQQQRMDQIRLQSQIEPRHPAESLLIPQSALIPMFMHKQQIYSDHRVPMPPQPPFQSSITQQLLPPYLSSFTPQQQPIVIPSNNLVPPAPPQYQSMPITIPMSEIKQFNNFDNKISASRISMNPNQNSNTNNEVMVKNYQQNNRYKQIYDNNNDNKLVDRVIKPTDDSDQSASRFDKHRPSIEDSGRYAARYRCYSCQWNIAHCSDFNCYNNPDICTTNNFAPHLVQQADCPGGCEQFVITDPNGLTQQWKRGCAQPGTFPIVRMRCHTYYEFGVRIDRCVCNSDWCNFGHRIERSNMILMMLLLMINIILIFLI